MKRIFATLLLCLLLVLLLALPVSADAAADAPLPEEEEGFWCFSREELAARSELTGVFVTAVPEGDGARVCLGSRVLRPGDAVSRADLARLRLEPAGTGDFALSYLPLEAGRLGEETVLTFRLERAEDEAPAARDAELETWRNLPNTGTLRGSGTGTLSFRLETEPRRGSVELDPDGSFTYTPRKNAVGEDSFTFTVTDGAGRVSAPATVRVTIRKPTDARTFADLDRDRQFEAIWLRETGLFGGELISERLSFGPERTVSRGEYLAMAMKLAGVDPEIGLQASGFADAEEAPAWLRPYLASALRRGWIRGELTPAGLVFRPNEPITRAEAGALTARILGTEESLPAALTDAPAAPLTRQAAAELLYAASKKE